MFIFGNKFDFKSTRSPSLQIYQVDMEVFVSGSEFLLVVTEVRVVKDFEGAALAHGQRFGLVLVKNVLQAENNTRMFEQGLLLPGRGLFTYT